MVTRAVPWSLITNTRLISEHSSYSQRCMCMYINIYTCIFIIGYSSSFSTFGIQDTTHGPCLERRLCDHFQFLSSQVLCQSYFPYSKWSFIEWSNVRFHILNLRYQLLIFMPSLSSLLISFPFILLPSSLTSCF